MEDFSSASDKDKLINHGEEESGADSEQLIIDTGPSGIPLVSASFFPPFFFASLFSL
jgi:hypothetical protein